MYKNAKSNLENLLKLGATILHGVDATKMKFHPDLKMRKFDRIIFNFPHAGFNGKEDDINVINMHKELVLHFFKNASCMLRAYGEIHVSHKTSRPFCDWNIEELACRCSLEQVDCVDFKIEDYAGYKNKRGNDKKNGTRWDEPFPLGECSTFKFAVKKSKVKPHFVNKSSRLHQYQGNPIQMQCLTNVNEFMGHRPSTLDFGARNANVFDNQFNRASETFERGMDHFSDGAQRRNYGRYMAEASETQQCQGNSIKSLYCPASFGTMYPQMNFNVNGMFMADESHAQQFRSNSIQSLHHSVSLATMNPRTSFDIDVNEHPGYIRSPLSTNIRRESVNASNGYSNHASEETWRHKVRLFGQHSDGTRMPDLNRFMAGAPTKKITW
ncbi:uncharacterized protein LOC105639143 isoform X2 [Jatropha curcas]|nr:uncharacterized protein LOC105639143 isoform X2 [Jatropha curcas]